MAFLPPDLRPGRARPRRCFALVLGCGLACLALSGDLLAEDDRARLQRGEILVSTQPMPNSPLPRAIVRGVVDAPPARVWKLVSECDRFTTNMPRVLAARQVMVKGDRVVCEVTIDMPFPLSNLRAVTRAVHVQGPPRWSRSWQLVEGDYEHNEGSFVLTPFDQQGQRTLVVYTVFAVPTSSVPEALQRFGQRHSLPGLIEHLRSRVAP